MNASHYLVHSSVRALLHTFSMRPSPPAPPFDAFPSSPSSVWRSVSPTPSAHLIHSFQCHWLGQPRLSLPAYSRLLLLPRPCHRQSRRVQSPDRCPARHKGGITAQILYSIATVFGSFSKTRPMFSVRGRCEQGTGVPEEQGPVGKHVRPVRKFPTPSPSYRATPRPAIIARW